MSALFLTAVAAFAAGLAGSGHCAGMCGGIAAAFGAGLGQGRAASPGAALAFNLARLAGYALQGALLAAGCASVATAAALPALALAGRLLVAIGLYALGLRLVLGIDVLGVERLGRALFAQLRPAFRAAARLPPALRPAALGLLWGWMPCGLVYSVLLIAAATARPAVASVTMLAFGAGTLPAMLALTRLAAPLGVRLDRPALRRVAGIAALMVASWTLAATLSHAAGHDAGAGGAHHPVHALAPATGRCAPGPRDCL